MCLLVLSWILRERQGASLLFSSFSYSVVLPCICMLSFSSILLLTVTSIVLLILLFVVIFLSILLWLHFFWPEGLLKTTSPLHKGWGKVCVHSTLLIPHLWDYTGDVVVLVLSMLECGLAKNLKLCYSGIISKFKCSDDLLNVAGCGCFLCHRCLKQKKFSMKLLAPI